jgi:5-methyltetrahydropteroyltriglutamate--homocysteine methyltransferase
MGYLCDEKMRDSVRRIGEEPEELLRTYAKLINDCIKDRPADMTVCMHICRGNFRSAWAAEGGYDPVAEILFNEFELDGFFLEYDTPRAGNFAPLRFVPKNKKSCSVLSRPKPARWKPSTGSNGASRKQPATFLSNSSR